MKAVRKLAPGFGHVDYVDVAKPELTRGYVTLQVEAAGICGTDLHIHDGEYASQPPVTMGHEVSGTVFEVGEGVTGWRPGDRVTTETFFSVCGRCRYCRGGQPNLCPERHSIGSGANGGFARYLMVPASNLHLLPNEVSFAAGALTEPLACCVHAVQRAGVVVGDVVLVSGPGPIGLLCVQLARIAGAHVVVTGTDADAIRLKKAAALGAHTVLNTQHDPEKLRPVVGELTDGAGFDVVMECAGAPASAASCLAFVRRGGRYAQLGLYGKTIPIDLDAVCFKELTATGTFAQIPSAWQTAIRLMASGQVSTESLISEMVPLSQWDRAFDSLRRKNAIKICLFPDADN